MKNIFEKCKSVTEVLQSLNLSDNTINREKVKRIAKEIGFDIEIYKNRTKHFCNNCGKELRRGQNKFCSRSCATTINNQKRVHTVETKEKIRQSLSNTIGPLKEKRKKEKPIKKENYSVCEECGGETLNKKKFCSFACHSLNNHKEMYKYFLENPEKFNRGNYTPKNFKDFFLNEQNGKCSICGCENTWNGKKLIFVLDHINGDSADNRRENLRLICPNCDSQTDTFKSKTKNSARRNYSREKLIRELQENFYNNIGNK